MVPCFNPLVLTNGSTRWGPSRGAVLFPSPYVLEESPGIGSQAFKVPDKVNVFPLLRPQQFGLAIPMSVVAIR